MHLKFHLGPETTKKIAKALQEHKTIYQFPITDDDFIEPADIVPIEGYEIPVNPETGKKFPCCCDFHFDVAYHTFQWFLKFPNCCPEHKALSKRWWFKKDIYKFLPEKILLKLSYTEYHISKRIETDNWYKDITDYMEYVFHSFGTPPIGISRYLANLKVILEQPREESILFPFEKRRKKLMEFIETQEKPPEKPQQDVELLIQTYSKWIDMIPNLHQLIELKHNARKKIPILHTPTYNPYLGLAKAKVKTRTELVEWLTGATKEILQSLNTSDLVKKGVISDAKLYRLQLAEERKRISQSNLFDEFEKDEAKYRKYIEKWLKIETTYFNEIEPIFKDLPLILSQEEKGIDKPKGRPKKNITFLQFFINDREREKKFFNLLQDLGFIDKSKNYIYPGDIRDLAIVFKALTEIRDGEGNAIVRGNISRAAMSRMILSEINGLNDPYETLKKGFSDTDPQRVDITEPTYIDFFEELKKKLA